MTNTWRIALICGSISGTLAGSSVLAGCANDVPTPPWYPNYVDSGYGGNGAAYGGRGSTAGATGKGGGSSSGAAGAAGEAGEGSRDGSAGEGGDSP